MSRRRCKLCDIFRFFRPSAVAISETSYPVLEVELDVVANGRVLERLLPRVRVTFGIDTSPSSLGLALEYLGRKPSLCLACMDSVQMGFRDRAFDLTICIQNGIYAFAVDQQQLFREAIRVTRSGGRMMFSSYTPQFWEHRLEWFEIQSAHHLIGEIDYQATGNGTIVCKDGFRATTAERQIFENRPYRSQQCTETLLQTSSSGGGCADRRLA